VKEKMKLENTFLKNVKNYVQNAEKDKYLNISLARDQEKKLEQLDPELYKKYLEVKERNFTEREKFKQEIKKIAEEMGKRLEKYNIKVIVDFDERGNPSYYFIQVIFPRKRLGKEEFNEFVREAKAIGLVFNPQEKTWGYAGKFGEYPPFKL
jgi:hypothetical protein